MNRKILLVEDELLTAEFMKIFLQGEGYSVVHARSAHDAMQLFDRENPDIVITDMMLSGSSGMEIARYVKQKPGVNVVGVTGCDKSHLEDLGFDMTLFDALLTKPLEFSELIKVLKEQEVR